MVKEYDWKKHYSSQLQLIHESSGMKQYYFKNRTGYGYVRELQVFAGMQIICNDLYLYKSGKNVPLSNKVIEITCCLEGRYECQVSDRYCFYMCAGDLAVGAVGRVESRGYFPTGRFRSVTIFVEPDIFSVEGRMIVKHLGLDFNTVWELAVRKPHYFILHQNPGIVHIMTVLADSAESENMPRVKLAALSLLRVLCEMKDVPEDTTVYLNRNQIRLAKLVHARLADDLSGHLTIEQLSEELGASPTSIKTAFKSVYGMPVYAWQRQHRLLEAQRLLRETELPAAEIARLAGYGNPGKFSGAFRQMFGITPTQYRNTLPAESNPAISDPTAFF